MKKVLMLLACCLAAATTTYAAGGHPHAAPRTIGQRLHHQGARIRADHRAGDLTNSQAAELHAADRGIHDQVKADRAADGGKLTSAQHAQVEQELNQVSHQIRTENKAGE